MNTEDIDNAIDVLQAMKAGKPVQVRSGDAWLNRQNNELPNFMVHTYRVKPEPREFYITSGDTDCRSWIISKGSIRSGEKILVREVIEDNIDNDSYAVTNKMKGIGG